MTAIPTAAHVPTPSAPSRRRRCAALAALADRRCSRRRARSADQRDGRHPTPRATTGSPPSSSIGCCWATSRCSAARPALAARAYLEAAREAQDPRIARRATEIALAARQRGLAQESAKLWADARSRLRSGRSRSSRRSRPAPAARSAPTAAATTNSSRGSRSASPTPPSPATASARRSCRSTGFFAQQHGQDRPSTSSSASSRKPYPTSARSAFRRRARRLQRGPGRRGDRGRRDSRRSTARSRSARAGSARRC